MKPIIVVNFKTYKQGKSAIELAGKISKIDKNIIIGVQASDIYEIVKKLKLKNSLYSQHVDYADIGRATGFILPEAVKKNGAAGSFLNHSEHKLGFEVLKKTMKRCKESGLKTIVFASSISEALKIEKLKPDYLIYEPPELVGGNMSVSKSKPEIISKLKQQLKMKFLVGAGVKDKNDLDTAIKLGASGIALSSAITKAKKPEKVLKELLR